MNEKVNAPAKNPEAKIDNKAQTQKTELSLSSPLEQVLYLQRNIGNQAVGRLLKSGALLARLRAVSSDTLRRAFPADELKQDEEEEELRTKGTSSQILQVTPEVENSINSIRGGGQPLPESARKFYEPRFGADFSQVRVHTDAKAAEEAKKVNAQAFTVGKDMVFGEGQFASGTSEGQRLIAHELTHLVEQNWSLGIIQRSIAKDLIDKHTSWGNLHEDKLGVELLHRAERGEYAIVQHVLDTLGSTDRDDVSFEIIKAANEAILQKFAQNEEGRRMLDRLFDELTAGCVSGDERIQADRILRAKARMIGTAQFEQGVPSAKVFPFRLPGLTVYDDAPISAERRSRGKIWVNMPTRVQGTRMFSEETRTLPTQVFTSGIELPENEIIGVKMYDLGGVIHYRPALYLIQLANETRTTIFKKMGEAAALGATLGTGALAGLGIKATLASRVLLWADRAAFALGTITSVIGEHRGWIIQRFGESGKNFLRYVDIINSAMLIYGGVRVVMGMVQLVNSFRTAYRNWQATAHNIEGGLNDTERRVVQQVNRETDSVLENADKIKGASKAPVVPRGEPEVAATLPKTPSKAVPASPLRTLSNATTTQINELKQRGFLQQRISGDRRSLLFRHPDTGQRVEIMLRQGGPSWLRPIWGRSRIESELRRRGFTLSKPTKGEGGLIYRNNITGEEVRIMPKPEAMFRDEPIEKHLNDFYYRYRPRGDQEWGPHTTIMNTGR